MIRLRVVLLLVSSILVTLTMTSSVSALAAPDLPYSVDDDVSFENVGLVDSSSTSVSFFDLLPVLKGAGEGIDPFSNFDGDAVVTFSTLDPVRPSDANGFKAVILSLLGDYESIVVQYQYYNTNGTVSYLREVYPDYPWIASAVIFLVVLYCCIRLGAAILCHK